MALIDTHAHLFAKQFDEDRDEIIQNALAKGVERIYLPNIDIDTIAGLNKMLVDYPNVCYGTMGLHPCSVKENYTEELEIIKKEFETTEYFAVGEIGIDLYWDKSTLGIQSDAFRIQTRWGKEMNLPIIIHCRDSFRETIEIVKEEKDERLSGIFHCFTGSVEDAKEIIDLGFKIGIGGVATFKNGGLDQVLPHIDLKHVVLETDAPYLSPMPFRGKRNESAYLCHIVEKLSVFYRKPVNEISDITTQNALSIFHK